MLKSVLRNGGEIMRKLDTVLLSEDNRIKFLRKSRHLTLRELGKILDIPDNSLALGVPAKVIRQITDQDHLNNYPY